MTASPIFFVLYKPYMPIIFYQKHFFKFSLLKKIVTFALRIGSICLVLSGLVRELKTQYLNIVGVNSTNA